MTTTSRSMAKSPASGRVVKRTASGSTGGTRMMNTRQRSRLTQASSNGEGVILQNMIEQAPVPNGAMGDVLMADAHAEVEMAAGDLDIIEETYGTDAVMAAQGSSTSPIEEKTHKPFPLFRLPPEIRNEVYRACLTRPFNILLSRKDPPQVEIETNEGLETGQELRMSTESDGEDDGGLAHTAAGSQPLHRSSHVGTGRRVKSGLTHTTSFPAIHGSWANRSARPIRLSISRSSSGSPVSAFANNARPAVNSTYTPAASAAPKAEPPRVPRPQDEDPLIVNLLRVSKQIYQEARSILYSENLFTLNLDTALPTLAALHQRSRRQIKHVELEIPCYNEILERFQETVRLSLRYCWGLKTFVIYMPFTLPGADGSGTTGNTTVYANGFDILRWLPRQCEVRLRGNVCMEIEAVVSKNANLAKTLDELAYARRQLISNETERTPMPA